MPRAQRLKVYRTAIGFHDAYVAAPSRKAALAAWGSEHDLFARGVAEQVDDPALTAEPLARPGTVIRRLRGSAAEQIAALPDSKAGQRPPPARTRTRPPKPDRAGIEAAEQALRDAEDRHKGETSAIDAEAEALARRRKALEERQRKERETLEHAVDRARTRYRARLERWNG